MASSRQGNPLVSGIRRLQVVLRSLGWAFDSITLITTLLDLVSTYWVCARLAGESEWLWFGLVLGGVVVGNLICAAFAVGEYQGFVAKNLSNFRGACRFLIIVPIAQLLPFLIFVSARFDQYERNSSAIEADEEKEQSRARAIESKRESAAKQQVEEGLAFIPEMAKPLNALPDSSDNDSDGERGLSVGRKRDNVVPIIPPLSNTSSNDLLSSPSDEALTQAAATFRFASRRSDWLSGVHPTTGAGKEAVAEVAESFIAMGTLEAAIKEHQKSHMYLYVAAAVWSMPQVVIQLLALIFIQHGHTQQDMGPANNATVAVGGFYGEATRVANESSQIDTETLLVISISLSLISLVLKGYAIAGSAAISIILWKFFCFTADVFGAVYVFATVAERSSPQQHSPSHTTPLFFLSELPTVTWIVQVLAIKWAMFCATFVLACAFFVGYNIKNWCPADLRSVRQFVLIIVIGVMLFFPSVVALEGFRLSCVALLLSNFEGKYMKQRTAFLYIYLGEWGDPRWLRAARAKLQKMCRCWSCLPFSGKGSQSLPKVQGLAVQQHDKEDYGGYGASQLRSRCGDPSDGQSDLIKKTKDLLKHSAREVYADFETRYTKRRFAWGSRVTADRATLRKRAAEEVSRHFAVLNYFCGTTSEEEEGNSEEEESAANGVGPQRSAVVRAVKDDQPTNEKSEPKQILLGMVPVPATNITAGGNIIAGPFSYVFGKLNGKEVGESLTSPRIGTMSEAKYKRFVAREDVRRRLVESLSITTSSEYERRLRLHMMSILTSPLYVIPAGTDMEVYRALRKGEIGLVKYNLRRGVRDDTRGAEDEEDAYIGDSEEGNSVRRPLLDSVEGSRVYNYDDGGAFGLQAHDGTYGTNDYGVHGGVYSAQKQRTRKRRRRRGGVTQWPHRMPFSEELLKAIISPKEVLVAVAVSPQELARVTDKSQTNCSGIGAKCRRFVRSESPLYSLPSCSSPTQRTHAPSNNGGDGFSVNPPVYFRLVSLCSAVPDMFADDIGLRYHWIIAPVISWLMDVGRNKHFLFPVGIAVAFTVFAVGQLYSLSLPFANVALDLNCVGAVGVDDGADENLLQKISFVAYAASLTLILLLSPFVIRFIFFIHWLKPILSIFSGVGETFTVPCLFKGIEDRHIPTSEALVREALGAHVKLQPPPLLEATSRQSGETRCDTADHKSTKRNESDTSDAAAVSAGAHTDTKAYFREAKRFVGTRRKGRGGCDNLLPLDLADVVASYIQPKTFDLRDESRADMERIRELGRL